MRALKTQIKKEWLEFSRDKLSLSLALLLPIFSLILFGYGIRLESNNIKMVVEDHDNTALTRELIAGYEDSGLFSKVVVDGGDTPGKALLENKARMALSFPKGFTRDVYGGGDAKYRVLIDGTDISNAQIMFNAVETINDKANERLRQKVETRVEPARMAVESRMLFNKDREESKFILPGAYGVILWMFPALIATVCAAREKEHGTITRVLSSRPNPMDYVLGKLIVYGCIGFTMAALIFLCGAMVFGIGSNLLSPIFLAGTMLYVVVSVLFGLMLGLFASSQTTAVQATSTLGFFPCLLLSGFVYPIENIPYPLSLLTNLVPARYYIELARDILIRGAGIAGTWIHPLALLLFILAFGYLCINQSQKLFLTRSK